ncbi:MAG TPA: secondary thiamine-phosphate synthase enzyme YjbQ [Candidatus Bathyarchaeia archaeon]|nr:secondary thiamine-phosphate synthase enzyme YjbQ [Candidatus Bathyarchaeia archaeon]
MTVHMDSLRLRPRGENDIIDITERVEMLIENAPLKNGVACLFVPGSTAALTTIEYEPGLLVDFPAMFERIVPTNGNYEHEKRWHDGNGHSHVRAALIGPDLFIPVRDGRLMLGEWQQIVFIEFDVRPRDRTVLVQLIGN